MYIFLPLPSISQESKARLEKLRRKMSNQAGFEKPTGPVVPGVLAAYL